MATAAQGVNPGVGLEAGDSLFIVQAKQFSAQEKEKFAAEHDLTAEELEGVIGHELAHVKHRDILIGTVAATIAGANISL